MPIPHPLPSPTASAADRTALRRPASIDVVVSSSTIGRLAARVTDLSLAGCRVALCRRLDRDQTVILTFPTLAPLGGCVAWSDGEAAGIAFARPLSAAVLAHLLARGAAADR